MMSRWILLGIRGLASGIGEWTQSGVGKDFPLQLTQNSIRHVLGFPLLSPEQLDLLEVKSVRFYSTLPISESNEQLGFRCARSLKPRFVKQ